MPSLLLEVVVLPGSPLTGRTLRQARFAEETGTVVLALHRRTGSTLAATSSTPLRAGDVLVVEGAPEALAALSSRRGLLVIGAPPRSPERPRKLWIALVTLAGVVTLAALGLLPIVTAATSGCAILMLTGCLQPREAYAAVDLSLVCLLAGTLALGTALEKVGLTERIGEGLMRLGGDSGPWFALVSLVVVSSLISEFISNNGTAALLGPVAISTAGEMGISPTPLLVAVAFGASCSFATPFGYQTSLMIYGPGGYRFRDFLRMGLPLDLLFAILSIWLIPRTWPFAPA